MEEGAPQEIKERLQWLLHYEQSGSASATCARFSVSRSTFYRWLHRFDPQNLTSLTDHPTRPAEEHVQHSTSPLSPDPHCPFCRLMQRTHRPSRRLIASLILLVFILTILLVVLPAAAGALAYRYSNPLANISEAFQLIDK